MARNHPHDPEHHHHQDQDDAASERAARRLLARRMGLDEVRPSTFRMLQAYTQWSGREADGDQRDAALAALALLPVARAELDALESAVLFAAKTSGLTWAQMATPMRLGSAQAAQQRLDRLATRRDQ